MNPEVKTYSESDPCANPVKLIRLSLILFATLHASWLYLYLVQSNPCANFHPPGRGYDEPGKLGRLWEMPT